MTQPNDNQTSNSPPPVEIQPTLKLALFIQYLQNNPLETSNQWEAAIKAWDENNLMLRNSWGKQRSP